MLLRLFILAYSYRRPVAYCHSNLDRILLISKQEALAGYEAANSGFLRLRPITRPSTLSVVHRAAPNSSSDFLYSHSQFVAHEIDNSYANNT